MGTGWKALYVIMLRGKKTAVVHCMNADIHIRVYQVDVETQISFLVDFMSCICVCLHFATEETIQGSPTEPCITISTTSTDRSNTPPNLHWSEVRLVQVGYELFNSVWVTEVTAG